MMERFWQRGVDVTPAATVVAVGDILLGRGVSRIIEGRGMGTLFETVREHLADGLTLGNLEGTISERGTPSPHSHSHFRSPPTVVSGLVGAGFDVLHLANNHISDFGADAVVDTLDSLHKAGIGTLGVGRTPEEARAFILRDAGPFRIAFLGATSMVGVGALRDAYAVAPLDLSELETTIADARRTATHVVVSLHFGHEDIEYPPPEDRQLARRIVSMGADAVLGHHPHVLHGMEVWHGSVIAHSLGNFVFDSADPRRRRSMLLRIGLDDLGVCAVDYLPVMVGEDGVVEIADDAERETIRRNITRLSSALADGSSDGLFWDTAGESFLAKQGSSMSKTYKRGGIRELLRSFRRIRPKHVRLLLSWALRKLGWRRRVS